MAGRVTAGEQLVERHLAAIFPFAAVVPRSSELFEGRAGVGGGGGRGAISHINSDAQRPHDVHPN